MINYFLNFFTLLIIFSLSAQARVLAQIDIERLEKELEQELPPSEKSVKLRELSEYYRGIDVEKGIRLGLQSLALARSVQDSSLVYSACRSIGVNYMNKGSYDSALWYFNHVIKNGHQTENMKLILAANNNRANVHYLKGEYDDALELYHDLLNQRDPKNWRGLSQGHINLGLVYWKLDSLDLGENHLRIALDKLNNVEDSTSILNHKIVIYGGLASMASERGDIEMVLELGKKALEISLRLGDDKRIASCYNIIGGGYNELGQLVRSLDFFKKALKITQSLNDRHGQVPALFNIGEVYVKLEKPAQALRYINESLIIAHEINIKDLIVVGYKLQFEILQALGDYRAALASHEKYIAYKDTLTNEKSKIRIEKLQIEYNTLEKDKELALSNAELARQTNWQYALQGGLLFIIIVAGLLYRSQRIKSRANQELAEKNQQIKYAEELKSRWFVNISHELKTPLTLVRGPIEKVLDEENVNEPGRQDLELAKRNVDQLTKIVSEILDISKVEEGNFELEPTAVDLSHLISTSVMAFESHAKNQGVRLQVQTSENIIMHLDKEKIRKVITNLMSNALKFTHAVGTIEASIEEGLKDVCFTIRDTGEGIHEQDQEHVFERFYQSTKEEKKRKGGTGIGLSLAKEIIELHQGSISVESVVGKGTAFTISLPATLRVDQQAETESYTQEEEPQVESISFKSKLKEKPSVLLVEDNADMREFVKSILKQDLCIIEATDGVEALVKLEIEVPDLIISDVMMPRMDGIEFADKVKSNPRWSRIPFITLTALDADEDKLQALRIGIDDYITKPFNAAELKARVINLLTNRQEMEPVEKEISYHDQMLVLLEKEVKQNIKESFLSVTYLADKASMSERKLQRYLKSQTGLTPNQFIREIKLVRSLEMLEKKVYPTVDEVAHAVGIETTNYLSEIFFKRFGKSPSSYL